MNVGLKLTKLYHFSDIYVIHHNNTAINTGIHNIAIVTKQTNNLYTFNTQSCVFGLCFVWIKI